jgi:hypothetical protein
MTGTPSQIQWAEQIKRTVEAEFDRVRSAFEEAARRQSEQDRMDTRAILVILQEKRMEVMAKDEAGYFIRDWQELREQVRQMIARDPAYQAINARRVARLAKSPDDPPFDETSAIE